MNGFLQSVKYTERHSHHILELIRMYLGFVLFMQGLYFIRNTPGFIDSMRGGAVPFASAGLAHYIIMAHAVGGLMIAVGLMTRLASILQIPILAGALLFMPQPEAMLAAAGTTPAFTVLILLLLVVFAYYGSGRWSLDRLMRRTEVLDNRSLHAHAH